MPATGALCSDVDARGALGVRRFGVALILVPPAAEGMQLLDRPVIDLDAVYGAEDEMGWFLKETNDG